MIVGIQDSLVLPPSAESCSWQNIPQMSAITDRVHEYPSPALCRFIDVQKPPVYPRPCIGSIHASWQQWGTGGGGRWKSAGNDDSHILRGMAAMSDTIQILECFSCGKGKIREFWFSTLQWNGYAKSGYFAHKYILQGPLGSTTFKYSMQFQTLNYHDGVNL